MHASPATVHARIPAPPAPKQAHPQFADAPDRQPRRHAAGTAYQPAYASVTYQRYAPQYSYDGGSCMCTSAAVIWAVACAARLARPQCPEAVMRTLMQRAAATHVAITASLRQRPSHMLQQNEARARLLSVCCCLRVLCVTYSI